MRFPQAHSFWRSLVYSRRRCTTIIGREKIKRTSRKRGVSRSFSESVLNRLVTFIQMLVGGAAIFASFTRGTIFYRFSRVPFPNQRLARIAFFVVGAGLFLGGLLSLYLELADPSLKP